MIMHEQFFHVENHEQHLINWESLFVLKLNQATIINPTARADPSPAVVLSVNKICLKSSKMNNEE